MHAVANGYANGVAHVRHEVLGGESGCAAELPGAFKCGAAVDEAWADLRGGNGRRGMEAGAAPTAADATGAIDRC